MRRTLLPSALVLALAVVIAAGSIGVAEGGPPWARLDGNNSFTGTNNFFSDDDFGFSVSSGGAGASIIASAHGDGNAVMGFANGTGAGISGRATAVNTIGVSAVAEVGADGSVGLAAAFEDPTGSGAAVSGDSFSPHAHAGSFQVWADNADQLFRVSQIDPALHPGPGSELGAFAIGNHGSVEISGDVELTGLGPSQNGDLTAAGSVYATSFIPTSSARFKNDITRLEDAVETVDRLRGVTFAWAESGRQDIGVVAEEVAEVLPELVRFDDAGQARGVDYSKLTAVLIEAVKSQQAEIRALREDISALQRRN